ncbi:HAD family hydrolase [Spongiibacter sp. KMU-158]|uniref:HAD family hydrolase n=1 Tax=Spongiibacter pelagi TaxID=2760804 RepID=A0A927C4Q2_9GAMM|nr:HAD family hydrolase [Spongiibacter pelagi]MBD2859390.1 HAD family hydrolase [Spongiibacter pelagi]
MLKDERTVALFDFDGTLTSRDSLMPFLQFVVGKPRFLWGLVLMSPILVGYFAGVIRNDVAKARVLKYFLEGRTQKSLFMLGEIFARETVPELLRAEGMSKLRWHQEQGHTCILVSASLDLWLLPWSKFAGFDRLICSELEVVDGKVTGRLSGNNCFGAQKVERLRKEFSQLQHASKVYAYGDSQGDMPMLRLADEGFQWRSGSFHPISKFKQ